MPGAAIWMTVPSCATSEVASTLACSRITFAHQEDPTVESERCRQRGARSPSRQFDSGPSCCANSVREDIGRDILEEATRLQLLPEADTVACRDKTEPTHLTNGDL